MPFDKPRHNLAQPHINLRVSHGFDGPGTISAVMPKGNNYLCIVKHDSGIKKGHFWASLTDCNVPAPSRNGPAEPDLVPA